MQRDCVIRVSGRSCDPEPLRDVNSVQFDTFFIFLSRIKTHAIEVYLALM